MGDSDPLPPDGSGPTLPAMKLPPFTLIHTRAGTPGASGTRSAEDLFRLVRERAPEAAEAVTALRPKLQQTLLTSAFGFSQGAAGGLLVNEGSVGAAVDRLGRVVAELTRHPQVVQVGIWDLAGRVGRLPQVIEVVNAAQPPFAFFEVHAAIPAGLVSRPERVAAWAQKRRRRPLTRAERKELQNNVIDEDFFERAEVIRKDLGIAYLVGITPNMIAGADEDGVDWNFFSSWDERLVLVSTFELREFARQAGRPFEACVAGIIVATLLVAMHFPDLSFHEEDRGCLFDYNEQRVTIVRCLKDPKIEPKCLKLIKLRYRSAAVAMVNVLRGYTGGTLDQSEPVAKEERRPGQYPAKVEGGTLK